VVWSVKQGQGSCPGPSGWHVSKNKPDLPVFHWIGDKWSWSKWLEDNRATRCTEDLAELEQAWHAMAEAQLAELFKAQAKYEELKSLPLIVLPD
jgi:hypothetical protein